MAPNNTTGSVEESRGNPDAAPENKENAEPDAVVAPLAGSSSPAAATPIAGDGRAAKDVRATAPVVAQNSAPNAPTVQNGTAQPNAAKPAPHGQRPASRPLIKCAKCARDNTPDSKFCRHCGAAMARPAVAAQAQQAQRIAQQKAQAAQVANGQAPAPVMPQANGAAQPRPMQNQAPMQPGANGQAAGKAGEGSLTPREIDERRARQLLDRALHLAEQKDLRGAIVACRQAIALAPVMPAAYSMLGLLLERGGNAKGAIVAYEKTLQLAPNSPVERESLMRLRAAQSQNSPVFHFDDNDLFADATPDDSSLDDAPAAPDVSTRAVSTQPSSVSPSSLAVTSAAAVAAPSVADAAVTAPAVAVNAQPAPVTTAPPSPAAALLSSPGALQMPPQVSPNDLPASPRTLWRAVRERPSFFMRTLPLLAVMPTSLLFLLWARNMAVSRNAPPAQAQQNIAGQTAGTQVVPDNTASTQAGGSSAPDGGNASSAVAASNATNVSPDSQRGAIPITNNWRPTPGAVAAPAAPLAPGNTTTNVPGSASPPRTASSPAARPPRVASRPVPSIPSPRTDTPRRDAPARNDAPPVNEPFAIPPARVLSGPPAEESIRVNSSLPGAGSSGADSGASTSGGAPLGSSGRRGSIRVITRSQPQPAIPNPSTADSPAIRPSTAPATSTTAYDRASRLQQRALILLERGDSAGAISDFRTAINLYNEQIATGARIAESRNGIASCRSGIQLAQSNR